MIERNKRSFFFNYNFALIIKKNVFFSLEIKFVSENGFLFYSSDEKTNKYS